MSKASKLERHMKQCSVCKSDDRREIDRMFINFNSPDKIVQRFTQFSRDAVYRHVQAIGLNEKKSRNVKHALAQLLDTAVDKLDSIPMTMQGFVAAAQALAKINARGEWVDRIETFDKFQMFERMTESEAEAYLNEGKLPEWAAAFASEGATNIQDEDGEEQAG